MDRKTLDRPPVSQTRVRRDLAALGVEPGTTLVVHSSLTAIGWVVGGPQTVVRALLEALGEEGTLVLPAATPQCADPATWKDLRVPAEHLQQVRDHLPVFDPRTTPTPLGAVPEAFRTWPGTLRSDHPLESVCARGPAAREITGEHPLAFSEGPGSPFDRLNRLDAWVLLLGVGFNRCTALHYAESLAARRRTTTVRFPALDNGRRVWVEAPNVADDDDVHFPVVGARFLAAGRARQGAVGEAPSILFRMQELVPFVVDYFDAVL